MQRVDNVQIVLPHFRSMALTKTLNVDWSSILVACVQLLDDLIKLLNFRLLLWKECFDFGVCLYVGGCCLQIFLLKVQFLPLLLTVPKWTGDFR